MLINLTDVFSSEGKVKEIEVPYEAEMFNCGTGAFLIIEKMPVSFKLSNIGTAKALVEGQGRLILEIPCDRCLKPVREEVSFSFAHEVMSPDGNMEESDEEMQSFMDGYELDVEDLIFNEIIINMPVKVLCRPDCKGICRVCGADLNAGDCGCDTFVPDPRMAAIKDIFNANKEV